MLCNDLTKANAMVMPSQTYMQDAINVHKPLLELLMPENPTRYMYTASNKIFLIYF